MLHGREGIRPISTEAAEAEKVKGVYSGNLEIA